MPIEVKSRVKIRSHAALDNLMAKENLKIPEAVVLSRENVARSGKVTYLPFYMSFCLDELVEKESDAADFTFAPAAL